MVKFNLAKFITKNQILIAGAGIIAVILFVAGSGMLSGVFNFEGFSFPQASFAPLQPETEFLEYNVIANIQPNPLCVGGDITATIASNIQPNGVCSIFMDNGTGFTLLENINLDAAGNYVTTQTIDVIGTATFWTTCCDTERNCRRANDVVLTVTNDIPPCLLGPAPPPGFDSDGDGFSDEEEEAADTNPFDPDNFPGSDFGDDPDPNEYTCGTTTACFEGTCPTGWSCAQIDSDTATWCGCISSLEGEGEIHPNWKPDGENYNPFN